MLTIYRQQFNYLEYPASRGRIHITSKSAPLPPSRPGRLPLTPTNFLLRPSRPAQLRFRLHERQGRLCAHPLGFVSISFDPLLPSLTFDPSPRLQEDSRDRAPHGRLVIPSPASSIIPSAYNPSSKPTAATSQATTRTTTPRRRPPARTSTSSPPSRFSLTGLPLEFTCLSIPFSRRFGSCLNRFRYRGTWSRPSEPVATRPKVKEDLKYTKEDDDVIEYGPSSCVSADLF